MSAIALHAKSLLCWTSLHYGAQQLMHLLSQVKVPQSGVRVLVASDGVWDAFEKMLRVCRMARSWSVEVCTTFMHVYAHDVLILQQSISLVPSVPTDTWAKDVTNNTALELGSRHGVSACMTKCSGTCRRLRTS